MDIIINEDNLALDPYFVLGLIPILSYSDPKSDKSSILTDNKGKSGIYVWRNKINGKIYVGSSVNLSKTLVNYFNESYLTSLKEFMIIYKALLVYGFDNFSLEILEHCDSSVVIEREQYYLDLLKPDYNILKITGSSLGFKHSLETKLKMKTRLHTKQVKDKIGAKNYKITPVVVFNKQTGLSTKFISMKKAAEFLNTSTTMVGIYIKNKKLFKGIYHIEKVIG